MKRRHFFAALLVLIPAHLFAINAVVVDSIVYSINTDKATLTITNPETSVVTVFKTGVEPIDIHVHKEFVYVVNFEGQSLTVVDVKKNQPKTIALKGKPSTISRIDDTLFIGLLDKKELLVVDCKSHKVIDTLKLTLKPFQVLACGDMIAVRHYSDDCITLIPSKRLKQRTYVNTCPNPSELIYNQGRLYLVSVSASQVCEINCQEGRVTKSLTVRKNPDTAFVHGNYLYVTSQHGRYITPIDQRTFTIVREYDTGKHHEHIYSGKKGLSSEKGFLFPFYPERKSFSYTEDISFFHSIASQISDKDDIAHETDVDKILKAGLFANLRLDPGLFQRIADDAPSAEEINAIINSPSITPDQSELINSEFVRTFCVAQWKNMRKEAQHLGNCVLAINKFNEIIKASSNNEQTETNVDDDNEDTDTVQTPTPVNESPLVIDEMATRPFQENPIKYYTPNPLEDYRNFPISCVYYLGFKCFVNYGGDTLTLINTNKNFKKTTIQVGAYPCLLTGCGKFLFISHKGNTLIHAINLETLELSHTISIKFTPTSCGTYNDGEMVAYKSKNRIIVFRLNDLIILNNCPLPLLPKTVIEDASTHWTWHDDQYILSGLQQYWPKAHGTLNSIDQFYNEYSFYD